MTTPTRLGLALPVFVLLAACGGAIDSGSEPAPPLDDGTLAAQARGELAPPAMGQFWTREEHEARGSSGGGGKPAPSPLMTFHGGKIMATYTSKIIFWGPSWNNPAFADEKITGLDSWYAGHSGSNYAKASNEYTGVNGQVAELGTHEGYVIDGSTATGGSFTSPILAEVCKQITDPEANGNGYYPVYTDVPRGRAKYCAWHSSGSCGGTPVQFAFFFNLDGDPGCDPQDTSGLHHQGLSALANVTGHELSEARSDPTSPGAWYDSAGSENGDKCAWTFGAPLVTFTNGTQWKIQGEWSNAAFDSNSGYPNRSGQNGCLSGL